MPKRKTTPHDNDAGLVYVTPNALTSDWTCVYDAAKQGLDTDGGRWCMVCSKHGTVINHTNKQTAMWFARNPAEWCEDCMEVEKDLKRLAEEMIASRKKAFVLCTWNPVYDGEAELELVAVIEATDEKEATEIAERNHYQVKRPYGGYHLKEVTWVA